MSESIEKLRHPMAGAFRLLHIELWRVIAGCKDWYGSGEIITCSLHPTINDCFMIEDGPCLIGRNQVLHHLFKVAPEAESFGLHGWKWGMAPMGLSQDKRRAFEGRTRTTDEVIARIVGDSRAIPEMKAALALPAEQRAALYDLVVAEAKLPFDLRFPEFASRRRKRAS